MKTQKPSLLLHPVFLLSLFMLVMNDFCWKAAYGNWLTGKLSDAAGLVVVPVMLRVYFTGWSKHRIVFIVVVFFVWWKSPFSQPLIDVGRHFQLPLQRIIDYTDLLTLPFSLLGGALRPKALRITPALQTLQRPLIYGIGFTGVLALCATTMPYRELYAGRPPHEVSFYENFSVKGAEEKILETLRQKNVPVIRDSIIYNPLYNTSMLYYKLSSSPDTAAAYQPVSPDSAFTLSGSKCLSIPFPCTAPEAHASEHPFSHLIKQKKTKSTVLVESFQAPDVFDAYNMDKETKQAYKNAFTELFR